MECRATALVAAISFIAAAVLLSAAFTSTLVSGTPFPQQNATLARAVGRIAAALGAAFSLAAAVVPSTAFSAPLFSGIDRIPERILNAPKYDVDHPVNRTPRGSTATFLQRDPSGYKDSVNLYAAFANDPVNNRDPTGRLVDGSQVAPAAAGFCGVFPEVCAPVVVISGGAVAAAAVGYGLGLIIRSVSGVDDPEVTPLPPEQNPERPKSSPVVNPQITSDPVEYERLRQTSPGPVYFSGSEEEAEGRGVLLKTSPDGVPELLRAPSDLPGKERKGLKNPFQGKTPQEIDAMFRAKGFSPKGVDPSSGKGSYINPTTGRNYYIDPGGTYKKGIEYPHVDVTRPKSPRPKRKFPLGSKVTSND